MEYSLPLKLTIAGLCEIKPENRLDSENVYQWLKRFHKEINELQYFDPGMPPVKDMNRYASFLKKMGPVHHPYQNRPLPVHYAPQQHHPQQQPSQNYQVFQKYADSHYYMHPQQANNHMPQQPQPQTFSKPYYDSSSSYKQAPPLSFQPTQHTSQYQVPSGAYSQPYQFSSTAGNPPQKMDIS